MEVDDTLAVRVYPFDGYYVAIALDHPGCTGGGPTAEIAVEELRLAIEEQATGEVINAQG
jgi:predicted RNase H-like HicB family nuclease